MSKPRKGRHCEARRQNGNSSTRRLASKHRSPCVTRPRRRPPIARIRRGSSSSTQISANLPAAGESIRTVAPSTSRLQQTIARGKLLAQLDHPSGRAGGAARFDRVGNADFVPLADKILFRFSHGCRRDRTTRSTLLRPFRGRDSSSAQTGRWPPAKSPSVGAARPSSSNSSGGT